MQLDWIGCPVFFLKKKDEKIETEKKVVERDRETERQVTNNGVKLMLQFEIRHYK